jgi:hypothetical protein
MASSDFNSCDWHCVSSVVALGHIDGDVGIFANSPHDRLTILLKVSTDSKDDSLE